MLALVASCGCPASVPGAGIRCQLLHNGGRTSTAAFGLPGVAALPALRMQQLACISADADGGLADPDLAAAADAAGALGG